MTHALAAPPITRFAADVREGLSLTGQKQLSSRFLYDSLGSKLFEAICELHEYGLTRADERLLQKHARTIAAQIPGDVLVCELGSGSGRKTRSILEALTPRGHITYLPIDISPAALADCRRELSDIESVSIIALAREYIEGLNEVAAMRTKGQRILVLFLGSTIGNFSHPADALFLREVRQILQPGDALLLGTDLEKPIDKLLIAYDDPLGVTAAFNLNLLARINRDLDANFNLDRFQHQARFNKQTRSIEMHLLSVTKQTVSIPAADLTVTFEANETIWTEASHKYSLSEVQNITSASGFDLEAQWIDPIWPFAETLLTASGLDEARK